MGIGGGFWIAKIALFLALKKNFIFPDFFRQIPFFSFKNAIFDPQISLKIPFLISGFFKKSSHTIPEIVATNSHQACYTYL